MEQLAQEYKAFRIDALNEREQNTFHFKMIGKSKSVLQWWMVDGTDWPLLKNLVKRVFSMAASSAASERKFSTQPHGSREGQEASLHQDECAADGRCAARMRRVKDVKF